MIRYPGSKDKIADVLMSRFPADVALPVFQSSPMEYREPFFGGGAVGLRAMRSLRAGSVVWINDKDYWLTCLWRAVLEQPQRLIGLVAEYVPRVDDFYAFKEEDGADIDFVLAGFRKLALHQISFSGNGVMAGGPIGGRAQRSEYNVNCRWNDTRLKRDIAAAHKLFRRFASMRITCGDFAALTDDAPPGSFIYIDPPYYKAGPQLYQHSMTDDDHARLAASLRVCRAPWVLSYDDHVRIRELYGWADIGDVELTYTGAIATGRRRKNRELLITPARIARAA